MAYTLGGQTLYNIQSETSTKDANLFTMNIPGMDSDSTFSLDIMGASRSIVVEGICLSTDMTISSFISWLDGLVSAEQTAISYASDTSGTSYYVLIDTVSWSRGPGEPNSITYRITMTQSSA